MGGRKVFFDYARQSQSDDVHKVIAVFDEACKASRFKEEHFDIVEACAQVEVEPSHLVGEVTAILYDTSVDAGGLISAINFPKVVQAAVEAALKPRGIHDRKMILQHHGYLPVPGKVVLNDRRRQMVVNNNPPPEQNAKDLPRFEDHVSLMGKALRGEIADGPEQP